MKSKNVIKIDSIWRRESNWGRTFSAQISVLQRDPEYLVPGKGAAKATTNLRPPGEQHDARPCRYLQPKFRPPENGQIGTSRRDPGGPRDKAVVQTHAVQGRIPTEQILGDQTV